ncbi:hypothetical protein C162_03814 [Paenibacillus sp. FSL R7-269]|nr:hypothetical protein C162_03814 [Paenibacillus sp. FSL R7-269]
MYKHRYFLSHPRLELVKVESVDSRCIRIIEKKLLIVWPTMSGVGMESFQQIARFVLLSKLQFDNLIIKMWIGRLRHRVRL